MTAKTKISCFRYNELWMDCALPVEFIEAIKKSRRNYHQRRRRRQPYQATSLSAKAAAKIPRMGPKYVVIKVYSYGAFIIS
jgi:hypothetical protein